MASVTARPFAPLGVMVALIAIVSIVEYLRASQLEITDHGRHVGRVGALAVALGIGAAVMSLPAVASAESSEPSGSSDGRTSEAAAPTSQADTRARSRAKTHAADRVPQSPSRARAARGPSGYVTPDESPSIRGGGDAESFAFPADSRNARPAAAAESALLASEPQSAPLPQEVESSSPSAPVPAMTTAVRDATQAAAPAAAEASAISAAAFPAGSLSDSGVGLPGGDDGAPGAAPLAWTALAASRREIRMQAMSTPPWAQVASATGNPLQNVLDIFISNGTAERPNAGLLIGNGYSWTAGTCAQGAVCNGGQSGLLFGNGGNGFAGGRGGSAGLFGDGGAGGVGVNGGAGGNGGHGGLFFGNGGAGGAGAAVSGRGQTGGRGGSGGATGVLSWFGVAGAGGQGGASAGINGLGGAGGGGGDIGAMAVFGAAGAGGGGGAASGYDGIGGAGGAGGGAGFLSVGDGGDGGSGGAGPRLGGQAGTGGAAGLIGKGGAGGIGGWGAAGGTGGAGGLFFGDGGVGGSAGPGGAGGSGGGTGLLGAGGAGGTGGAAAPGGAGGAGGTFFGDGGAGGAGGIAAAGGVGGRAGLLGSDGAKGAAGGTPTVATTYVPALQYIQVQVRINNQPVTVELDTGSAGLIVPITMLDAENLGPTTGQQGTTQFAEWGRFTYTVHQAALDFGNGMVTAGTPIGVVTQVEVLEGTTWVTIPPDEWSDPKYAAELAPVMGVGPYTGFPIASPVRTLPGSLNEGLLIDGPLYPPSTSGQVSFGTNPLPVVTAVPGWFYTELAVEVSYFSPKDCTANPANCITGRQKVTATIDSGGLGGGLSPSMLPKVLSDLSVEDRLPVGTTISVYTADQQTLLYSTTVTEGDLRPVPEVWDPSLGFNTGILPFFLGPIYFSYTPTYTPVGPDNSFGGTTVFDYMPA